MLYPSLAVIRTLKTSVGGEQQGCRPAGIADHVLWSVGVALLGKGLPSLERKG